MKKLFVTCLSLIMMFMVTQFSIEAKVLNDKSNYSLSIGNKSIEYSEELNGFILENVTVDEVIKAFDSSGNYERIGDVKNSNTANQKVLKTLNLEANRAGTYTADYTLSNSVKGIHGENVKINYTCNMVMTTVNHNGTNYAQFVSFNLNPTFWLNSGSYSFGTGTGTPQASIRNGGATIRIMQIVQLQTQTTVNVNVGISAGWINIGGGTSTVSYFRSQAITYTTTTNLPLINIIT